MRRVVVTGLGAVSPAGTGKAALWETVAAGTSVTKSLSSVRSSDLFGDFDFDSDAVAEVPGFDEVARTLPVEVRRLDRFIQFGVAATLEAVADAGLGLGAAAAGPDAERTGVALATAICGTRKMEEEFLAVTDNGRKPIDPSKAGRDLYLASMSNTPSVVLSAMLGAQGPCLTLSTGCVGGLDAIGYAYDAIRHGDADVMVAGATEAPITPITVAAFEIINCLSRRHRDRPHAASRPFDADRDGFVLAEGCGIVVLEELEHARARGAHVYMEITGFSNTSNAMHMTDLLSDGADLTRAMTQAMVEGGTDPADVDHVNAHGSSTPQNDVCESSAIRLALGERAYQVPVNSTKSMFGHALAAASAMEMVVCALAFAEGYVHPTANLDQPGRGCDLDYVPGEGRAWDGDVILTDASGFSGLHAAMVLRRAPDGAPA